MDSEVKFRCWVYRSCHVEANHFLADSLRSYVVVFLLFLFVQSSVLSTRYQFYSVEVVVVVVVIPVRGEVVAGIIAASYFVPVRAFWPSAASLTDKKY